MHRAFSLPLAVLLFLFFAGHASASSHCEFRLGFKFLRDLIGHDIVGECLENEHYNHIGDSNQHTTGGLMAWRKADNWTAFTDGYRTWVNGPYGLVQRLNTERFEWEADYAEIVLGVKPTPTPVPPARPTPTPRSVPTAPTGSTINDPIASNGSLVSPHGMLLTTIAFTAPDAWPYVLASNQFNDPPDSSWRHFIIGVVVTNTGDRVIEVDEFHYKLVGDQRVVYDQFDNGCGVLDEELDVELFPDGSKGGLLCFHVPRGEDGWILIYEQAFLFNAKKRFLKVPEGCQESARLAGTRASMCKNTLNRNFDFSAQIRALGLDK